MAGAFEFLFLGTGTSVGVPVIGCACPVCTSADPRNRRTRSSVLVRTARTSVLVDSGPDLRGQALREGVTDIDAILYTHSHLDHVAGFDDLRAFCWRRDTPLPLHATPACLKSLRTMFGWAFAPENRKNRGYVQPDPRPIRGPFRVGEISFEPLPVVHAKVKTIGFLVSVPGAPEIAYIPDAKSIPAATAERLAGVPVLVIDALRPSPPHPTHMTTEEALALAERLGAGTTYLTHLGHENDHAAAEARLPPDCHLARDGLKIRAPLSDS